MEKFNFKGGENILKSICWILSYLTWILVAVNNLASLKYMYMDDPSQIWGIHIIQVEREYFPIQMDRIVIYIVYNIWIFISIIGCAAFIIKTLFKKENSVIDGMMGKFSQFHFFPLLCAFIMIILGEIIDYDKNAKHIINTGLSFSLFGTASMVFIYVMTEFKTQDWWAEYTLKKGTFSCLVILFWYNFCYDIYWVRYVTEEPSQNFTKNCGMAFSLLFGIGSLAFSVVYRDIIMSFMNFLINIGMAKYYFELGVDTSLKDYNKNGDGAIDILVSVLSLIWFLYLVIDIYMEGIQSLKQQVLDINQVQTLTIAKVNTNAEQINFISTNVNLPTKNLGETEKN